MLTRHRRPALGMTLAFVLLAAAWQVSTNTCGKLLALGCDPAHDIAYWFMWHEDSDCLDALLAGYRPRDPVDFRRRIGAHITLLAVKFSVWFHSRGETANVQRCTALLRKNDMKR